MSDLCNKTIRFSIYGNFDVTGNDVGVGVRTWLKLLEQVLHQVIVLSQQTCRNDASGPTYRSERLGCWIRAMNCRCWKMMDRFMCWAQVKVMGSGVRWLPYLSFYWFCLHQSCMDASSCNIDAFNRLGCWVWDKGIGC